MKAFRTFVSRLTALARTRKHDREIDDQIASHLEEATDEYIARGLSREDARLAAIRDFGGITQCWILLRQSVRGKALSKEHNDGAIRLQLAESLTQIP